MIDKLKSTEYFFPFPNTRFYTFFIALFQLIDMSAVCALLNLYGSRRRFPPWTEFASARSPNLYPQYKVKDVTLNLVPGQIEDKFGTGVHLLSHFCPTAG